MTDILGRKLSQYGGSFSVDDAQLTFPNIPGRVAFVPFVVTNMGLTYGQQLSRFYGLNRSEVFLVAGRAQGQAQLSQILSPQGALESFFETYGDVCKAEGNDLQFRLGGGCNDGGQGNQETLFNCGMCVLTQTQFGTDSESAVVNNSFGMSFENLEFQQQLSNT